jgi:polysaccharide pyruvyl transferase WcaK-like protein
METELKKSTTIFTVTDFNTNEVFEEAIEGDVNEAIEFLRKEYPRYSKIVLRGFEIDDKFIPLDLETDNLSKR